MIEICENHTGKMEDIQSISTSVLLNPNCQKNQEIKGSICSHCYAENMAKMYGALAEKLARNTAELTKRIIPTEELPDLSDQKIFRFESFGDLNNEIQLINYINIAKKNPETRFTLWTKMYELVYDYFKREEIPSNFTLILSSLMTNVKINLEKFKALGKFEKGQLKSFTVYDKNYIKAHIDSLTINCGSRCCVGCRKCYDKNEIEEISEILKSDQDAVETMYKLRCPEHLEKLNKILNDLRSLQRRE